MADKTSKKPTGSKKVVSDTKAEKKTDSGAHKSSGKSSALKQSKSKIRALKTALKKQPKDVQLNYLLGMEYLNNWELEPAIEALIDALDPYLDADPKSLRKEGEVLLPQIIFALSNTFMANGELDGAQDVCEIGISIYPKYGDIFLKAGIIKQHKNEHEEAIEHFKKAIKFQVPPFGSYPFTDDLKLAALRGIATSFFYLDELSSAEKYYIKALGEDPKDVLSIQGLTFSLRGRFETKVALKKVEKYAQLDDKELFAEVLRLLTDLPLQF